jgi:hypothetical protein
MIMRRRNHLALLLSLTVVSAGMARFPATATAQPQAAATVEDIRKSLLQLPYYSVFDFLAFNYDKGTVTLLGYAYHPGLKADALRAVKRVSGVDDVIDKVEELPVTSTDEELRWRTYYAIYDDPFLSRYAPGGGLLWGHRHGVRGRGLHPMGAGPFLGYEPAGNYPIHIVVRNGRITLLGVVDNEGDKNLAGLRARGVPGSFGVDNQLMSEKDANKTS